MEEQILEVVERQPAIRVRGLVTGTSTRVYFFISYIKEQQFHLYHIQSVQELELDDAPARRTFNKYILQK